IKKLWSSLMDIFDSVVSTLGEKEISFSELSRIIRSMTARLKYSVPPQTIDSVIAASARTARLNSPKILFAIGSTEGDFPNQVSLHGLFSENDKEKLSEKGIEIARPLSDLIASERLIVYKTLSTASEKLYITYPLSDLSGQAKYPSQVIGDIISMFGCEDKVITDDKITPDYYAVTLHSAFYRYMRDFKINDSRIAAIGSILVSDENYRRRIEKIIKKSNFEQNYRIDRSVMEKLKRFDPLYISPTALENYNKCHFMYFCNSILKLHTYEKIDIDVKIAGDITHECFRGILKKRTKQEFTAMSYEQICSEIKENAEEYRNKNLAGDFGKTARFEFIFKKLTEDISNIMIHTQHSLMASDFMPKDYEIKIENEKSVTLPFGKGNILRFSGKIDRVDECIIDDKKYMRIIDYKSSKKEINSENLASGLNMQMLLYLFAATDSGGIYDGYVPAGVLYSPVKIKDIAIDDSKDKSFNQSEVNKSLKTTGLVLGSKKVINAMEKNGAGNYIPAKIGAKGDISKTSSCISSEGMKKLKEYTYGKLVEMAESLLSGNAEPVPLMSGKSSPCDFCGYADICGNSDGSIISRTPDEEELEKVEKILSDKLEKE
ncbi:MAG: PD-(D/E)XK nuclease family protein, partial [Ruminococcus sp.]|nr:PD-(D/E)XK nuclease family protein [Ruminococcus sp.]